MGSIIFLGDGKRKEEGVSLLAGKGKPHFASELGCAPRLYLRGREVVKKKVRFNFSL